MPECPVIQLGVGGMAVAVAVHAHVVHHINVDYIFAKVVGHALRRCGHALQKVVLLGQVLLQRVGAVGVPGRVDVGFACGLLPPWLL